LFCKEGELERTPFLHMRTPLPWREYNVYDRFTTMFLFLAAPAFFSPSPGMCATIDIR
jgi:hypothetical protein